MSKKNTDNKGRFRSVTIGFRASPEEAELINKCVALSGLSKQDYLIKRASKQDVIVQGNPRVYKALKNELSNVYCELKRIEQCSEANDEFLTVIAFIGNILNEMRNDKYD